MENWTSIYGTQTHSTTRPRPRIRVIPAIKAVMNNSVIDQKPVDVMSEKPLIQAVQASPVFRQISAS
jgi:hypothetical protein